MATSDIDDFVEDYVKELHAGTAAVFLGAGMSVAAGFVDWTKLLKPLAKQLGLDADREAEQLVTLAQYHVNAQGDNRSELHKRLLTEFPAHKQPHENHRLLARLPLPVYWTTNYDHLIETSLKEAGRIYDPKWQISQLAHTVPRRDAVVYKMHGDVTVPESAVLTRDDYEKYMQERGAFVNALSGDLVSRTFLFLGFSFRDPNLDYILSRIRLTFKTNARQHYCVFKKIHREAGEKKGEYEYRQVKQRLLIADLRRFNIKALLLDSYEDVTKLLRRIERAYRRRSLFISGSAVEFGGWAKEDVSEFLFGLGKLVVERRYRLISGFGWGLSNELLSGAIESIYERREGHLHDFLVVRPFPRSIADKAKRDKIWHEYRRDLISQAGIALFLFGNKEAEPGGKVVLADGVQKEFAIAQELDLVTLPVGATGYAAKELVAPAEESMRSLPAPAALKSAFASLQRRPKRPQELLARIASTLDAVPKV